MTITASQAQVYQALDDSQRILEHNVGEVLSCIALHQIKCRNGYMLNLWLRGRKPFSKKYFLSSFAVLK